MTEQLMEQMSDQGISKQEYIDDICKNLNRLLIKNFKTESSKNAVGYFVTSARCAFKRKHWAAHRDKQGKYG